MNPFADTMQAPSDIQQETDRLGGGGFIWESGAYPVTILAAYSGVSKGGAKSMNFEVQGEDGRKFKWTEWVTSGTAKGGLPYSEKDGKKTYLPGFNISNAIAMFTTKKELGALVFETKTLMLRNFDLKKDVPTDVSVATEMTGKKIILGIQKIEENKTVKVKDAATGKEDYKPTAETKFTNNVDKVFYIDNKATIAELREAKQKGTAPSCAFYDKWVEANEGKVINKVKTDGLVAAQGPGATPAPQAAGGGEVESLFD